jgi:hypothetical protein
VSDKPSERRAHIRKSLSLPVTVRGRDVTGAEFECSAMLHDIGEGGARMRLTRGVEVGAELFIRIGMSAIPQDSSSGSELTATGRVLRVGAEPFGSCDVALQFSSQLTIDQM